MLNLQLASPCVPSVAGDEQSLMTFSRTPRRVGGAVVAPEGDGLGEACWSLRSSQSIVTLSPQYNLAHVLRSSQHLRFISR